MSASSSDRPAMRPFADLVSLAAAREVAARLARPVDAVEDLPVSEASGRVLARDAVSRVDVPSADRAAMDGFAVRAEGGLGAGASLRRVGRLAAGEEAPGLDVTADICLEIATGAPLPAGADAVVAVERTERDGDTVRLLDAVEPGQHVSRTGEDLRRGRPVGQSGDRLTPALLAACAAGGCELLCVWKRPRVLVAPTGDEVVPLGERLRPGQVYDSNAVGLVALLRGAGALAERTKIVADERQLLARALVGSGCDLVVTIGGTSVGRRDLVSDVVDERGEVLVHGVAVKPGKPLLLGTVGDTPIVGLPGFPTTCMMLAYALLTPMVRAMARLPVDAPALATVLAEDVDSPPDKTQLLPVVVDADGAHPTFRFSSAVSSMARASGWIEIDAGTTHLEVGAPVTVRLF